MELTEAINSYSNSERNFPTETHRNRVEPDLENEDWPRVPFGSIVVPM